MTTPYEEISKEDIQHLDLYYYEGETIVIEKNEDIPEAINELYNETIIGIDTERKPSFKKGNINPVSLIQLATRNKVYLFRINFFKIPDKLISIFENPEILKIGVGLDDDLQGLKELKPFTPKGFVDLSKYFQKKEYKQSSLKYLAATVLNVRISKGQQVSNWERTQLTSAQIKYAATDAWVPRKIYLSMIEDGNFPQTMTD
ncbi:MAG: 3'-5' exonuclease domain-containing protein 2 [Bacteroidales bacterium]|nr:3'-5' exonuclease domain-containing protein 2 [Bacteroidales bacterium]